MNITVQEAQILHQEGYISKAVYTLYMQAKADEVKKAVSESMNVEEVMNSVTPEDVEFEGPQPDVQLR